MTAYKKKITAFKKAIRVVEMSAQNNSFLVSDESFQALYNTYEKLKEMFPVSDESRTSDFLMLQI
ncbi:MAG: hypothetical protein D3909_12255 [Candidatus Electrothrix sp. ATG1]|nr:hypothetical protein [Candidatus Electrothrix sp. ATG1]MCI5210982.1 hypothetical protein [Candidatus Electrothrix sp. ATG2]